MELAEAGDAVPRLLYHYYAAAVGPLRTLSDLPPHEAEAIMAKLRREGSGFASRRSLDYLTVRRGLESRVRALFLAKGGRQQRRWPLSFVLGPCPWVQSWYEDGCACCVPLATLPRESISFTYGDLFPALRYDDGHPTHGQVYTVDELPALIEAYGLPQMVNPNGKLGPRRYIEAQVWDKRPLRVCIEQTERQIRQE